MLEGAAVPNSRPCDYPRVLAVGSDPATTGLKPDDVITKFDMTNARSPPDVFDADSSRMGRARLEVFREGVRGVVSDITAGIRRRASLE